MPVFPVSDEELNTRITELEEQVKINLTNGVNKK